MNSDHGCAQIATHTLTQSEITIAIGGKKAPAVYFTELLEQCQGGEKKYGGITDLEELQENFGQHCIPTEIWGPLAENYDNFLEQRRKLMAAKIKGYFDKL